MVPIVPINRLYFLLKWFATVEARPGLILTTRRSPALRCDESEHVPRALQLGLDVALALVN
jgi:hypothetical protein